MSRGFRLPKGKIHSNELKTAYWIGQSWCGAHPWHVGLNAVDYFSNELTNLKPAPVKITALSYACFMVKIIAPRKTSDLSEVSENFNLNFKVNIQSKRHSITSVADPSFLPARSTI